MEKDKDEKQAGTMDQVLTIRTFGLQVVHISGCSVDLSYLLIMY